ncbi:hypothetical protein [Actinomycetospora sp.]|jgi:hypothetical protein|uniref:hypothetical protein n=1 Tax=Actinomycetospora sp. TaxID=1872135 RepID=UPI002F3ECC60
MSTETGTPQHQTQDPTTTRMTLPWLGTFEMSRPELVFVGGIAALGMLGFLDWPLALVLGAGHLLAADRSSRRAREFGEALEQAE